MNKPLWVWVLFLLVIGLLLAFDLGVFGKKDKQAISIKESLLMSLFYFLIACIFGLWLWYYLGNQKGGEYFTGYFIEKTLSLDNVFVISMIFSMLAIEEKYQYRVLFWGILGAIVLRAIMIALGVAIVNNFYWVLYIFAIFLIYTGMKMLFSNGNQFNVQDSKILSFIHKYFKITDKTHGNKFIVRYFCAENNKMVTAFTPLFVAFFMIMFIDLIFAVDSVPAIFSITSDIYIIYTSNIFAVLGLRALYFAMSAMIDKFYYLKYSLSLVLIFIGSKIFVADFMGWEKFPTAISLSITVGLILLGVLSSLVRDVINKRS